VAGKCRTWGSVEMDATSSESDSYCCKIEGKIGETPGYASDALFL
jgi:hypothetical protein